MVGHAGRRRLLVRLVLCYPNTAEPERDFPGISHKLANCASEIPDMPMWQREVISFQLDDEMTSDPVFTVVVVTPVGRLKFMAEPELIGSVWWLRRAHVQGARANSIGVANLMVLAQALMEKFGYDEIVVEGAVRTTGAHPGRRSRAHRFFRRVRSSSTAAAREWSPGDNPGDDGVGASRDGSSDGQASD
jgi:hypothetical protein